MTSAWQYSLSGIGNMEKKIGRLFHRACSEYSLLKDGDRVLVALSGGKDSLMLVRLLGGQSRIFKPRIEVEAVHVVMDNIPYETDRSYIQGFCEEHGVRLTILHSYFDDGSEGSEKGSDAGSLRKRKTKCFLCSWNRRKAIFRHAAEHGFNKVALGHHQDDILTTLLMNMAFEGSIQTMPPRLKMTHYPVEIIRPLCLVPERLVREHAAALGFEKQKTPCPYDTVTKRKEMGEFFHALEAINPDVRHSLWNSMRNIYADLLP